MPVLPFRSHPVLSSTLLVLLIGISVACGSSAVVSDADIQRAVRPGQPGEQSAILTTDELVRDDLPPHTAADTYFMQGMIAHHAQALVMTALVPERTTNPTLLKLAQRIEISQGAEIKLMQSWLRSRGEFVPMIPGVNSETEMDAAARDMQSYEQQNTQHSMAHDTQHTMLMPGMLSSADLETLAAASGAAFDNHFLTYMIGHHEGALTMVKDLFTNEGAGQDTDIFLFASDVDIDQRIEIDRMYQILDSTR